MMLPSCVWAKCQRARRPEVGTILGHSAKIAEWHRARLMEKLDIHDTAGLEVRGQSGHDGRIVIVRRQSTAKNRKVTSVCKKKCHEAPRCTKIRKKLFDLA
jgi:hypothetical protein